MPHGDTAAKSRHQKHRPQVLTLETTELVDADGIDDIKGLEMFLKVG